MPEYPFDDLISGRPETERARITEEAVSAYLDGELGAFAADLDLPLGDVQHRLERWPGFAVRRAELQAARTSLRSEPASPALDELTRRRLLAGATRVTEATDTTIPDRPGRSRNRWVALSAAAAVLVVAGAVAVLRDHGGGTSRTAADAPTVAAVGYVGDLGDVSDPNTLRAAVADHLGTRGKAVAGSDSTPATTTTMPATPEATKTPSESLGLASGSTAGTPPGGITGDASSSAKQATPADAQEQADRCAASIVKENAPGRTVLLTAIGVYRGQSAAVVTIRRGQRTVTFIADLATCAVVGGQAGGSG